MHRIDHATRSVDENGAGKDGFTGGDPDTLTAATTVTADWLNSVQEELARAIEVFGLTLDKANPGQLAAALQTIGADLFTAPHTWNATQKFLSAYVANHLGLSGEVLYANPTTGATVAKERTVYLPLTDFRAIDGTWNGPNSAASATWAATSGYGTLYYEGRVPEGTRLVRARAGVRGTGGVGTMELLVMRRRYAVLAPLTWSSTLSTLAAADNQVVTTDLVLEAAGDLTFTASDTLCIRVATTQAGQQLGAVELSVLDPGPRSW